MPRYSYLCDRQELIGREMFAIDGVKLPANASKAKSGTRADFQRQADKLESAAQRMLVRNLLVHAPAGQRRVVSALVATIFAQTTERAARDQWRTVADQLRERFPKIARHMDEAEDDVLAHMSFPKGAPRQDSQYQPARAIKRRDQAAHRRREHLPQ